MHSPDWLLIKHQWGDKDELGESVAPSPAQSSLGVSLTVKPIFVLTCQWPAPLHPVASKGMVNQAFHVPRHSAHHPTLPPRRLSAQWCQKKLGLHPLLLCHAHALVFSPPSCTVAHCTAPERTKLMSQMWERTKHTVHSDDFSPSTAVWDLGSSSDEVWKPIWPRCLWKQELKGSVLCLNHKHAGWASFRKKEKKTYFHTDVAYEIKQWAFGS